ncbi:MAG: GDP-mannose 4,6-dehydratase [Rhodospirillales bacterium]|nr:GDP-mannose 4,6-dehydratase [Rhodospirillales bacterium]
MTFKTALITGITGQDGPLLAEFLLEKGYRVVGARQWSPLPDDQNLTRLEKFGDRFSLRPADMSDSGNLTRLLAEEKPDEIYNLAAQSHVAISYDLPEMTADVNALGPLRLLEAIRTLGMEKTTRFYQASSSEMFGNAPAPQSETTPFAPCSPYAAAKLYAYWITVTYRNAYGIHASNGILFNHESPIRGQDFVTRKITHAVAKISLGGTDPLVLGNLDSRRDWGHARDYVEGMWQMLQQDTPGDYVLATGESRTVRACVEQAFSCIGLRVIWRGRGPNEIGCDPRTGRVLVRIDPALFRPNEVHALLGDSDKARRVLGWKPKISFADMIYEMVQSDRQDLFQGTESLLTKSLETFYQNEGSAHLIREAS